MNELINRLKSFNPKNKNKIIIIACVVALVILLISDTAFKTGKNIDAVKENYNAEIYIEKAEKDLQKLLEGINGAGRVKVLITLESCYENVYAKGYNVKNNNDKNYKKTETEEEYVVIKNGSSNEECLILKVNEPQIKGVAVVAEGADNITVKKAITETVCALYNISSASVSVTKMINK